MGRDDYDFNRSDRDDRDRERSVDDRRKERHRARDTSISTEKRAWGNTPGEEMGAVLGRYMSHFEPLHWKMGNCRNNYSKYKEKEMESCPSRKDVRERVKEKMKEKEKDKGREKDRDGERGREREKEKERERVRTREREERKRVREMERIMEKGGREREREREREKRRELDRDGRKHGRKRRREKERERERESECSRFDRHMDDGEDVRRKHADNKKETRSRDEEMEEEQKKLDEEMDKRRRRVQEWQELKRKEEEHMKPEEPKSGKWGTLEGEFDDEAAPVVKTDDDMDAEEDIRGPAVESQDEMMVDSNKCVDLVTQNGGEDVNVADEVDPLDAFMNFVVLPEVEQFINIDVSDEKKPELRKDMRDFQLNRKQLSKGIQTSMGRIIPGEDSDSEDRDMEDEEVGTEDEDHDVFMKRVKKTKVEKLSLVDHSKIDYPPFRKNFYIEAREISRMTSVEVAAYMRQLELQLHGTHVPKPIRTWIQTGLTSKILNMIKKLGFDRPMPIQAQALPIIMSGRDCIGLAKTGTGKTLAFVLPMLRHIKDQPPVVSGDGPIGLIMAPTRELVQQIHSDIKKFAKAMGVSCVPVYGGSGVAQQINDLKRGCEIVVCTPGRMIDILCTSSGKITNLRRVTYLVMDEADRMFDMGFEPQIARIVQNTRPDRQTVLFSATFPQQVEILARKVLTNPVEIQIGGRSVVNKDITQLVEVRPEGERFLRLLELLWEWSEKGKILIFVKSIEKCDALFKDLMKHGYPCLSLHGGKDQTDRESSISDYKSNVCNLMVATSVASRGLDVKELDLVINYDVPNHYEEYVHRAGRTGRAGRKGCAITFISEEDDLYAPAIVKALKLSEQAVPADLKALADGFKAKKNQGLKQAHGTGYGGSGYKFNEVEDEARKDAKKAQAREYGFEEDKSDSDDDDEIRKAGGDLSQQTALAQATAKAAASKIGMSVPTTMPLILNGGVSVSRTGVGLPVPGPSSVLTGTVMPNEAAARATALAAAMNLQHSLAKIQADAMPGHDEAEFEINEFPQNARRKVTQKETLCSISEQTGASITTRGQYYPPGKIPGRGDRKLYLFIEGATESSVKKAKAEVKRVLEDITEQSLSLRGASRPSKYSVL